MTSYRGNNPKGCARSKDRLLLNFEEMTVEQIKGYLKANGQLMSGNKAALITGDGSNEKKKKDNYTA
jgi:hypothetical protein